MTTRAFLDALRTPAAAPTATAGPWPWHLALAVHAHLPPTAADAWAARLPDPATIPTGLRPVHRWHADTVLPLLARQAPEPEHLAVLGALHRAAAQGETADRDTWRAALGPVLRYVHDAAYDRAGAYAEGFTGARDYATANGFSPAEADTYARAYAESSSDTNARACADAHARALGDALAVAYAHDDQRAYADTWPGAQLRAVVRATTAPDGEPHAILRLAEGLLAALAAD
ncbi:hypothetical protein [Streptomyces sp. NPDC087212]|uniref:hypothetical protein n=1 Tax=Streptomyces sp. NPDC087212 TaxID=3365766 RepID=UPI0038168A44